MDFPAPSWIPDGAAFLAKETLGATVDVRQTALYLPQGESLANWSRVFVLMGFDQRGQNVNGKPVTHENYVATQIAETVNKCGKEHAFFTKISSTEREYNLLAFCEAGLNAADETGYDSHHGIVGLHSVFSYLGRVISVSQEWRGSPFDVRDKTSWPVNPAELALMQARFRSIRVLGSTRPQ